ncbi:uncharacterized protein UTRI_05437_B [Ustilago trichophora]|uniref:Uncharacterized protein n=1 Tax=Ustilago trichophora TaxID=86804 RepID=A0A5C3EP00_9BASI|nr:uncharacterized protein UTRI_05437_B [Ustilago trichophora]
MARSTQTSPSPPSLRKNRSGHPPRPKTIVLYESSDDDTSQSDSDMPTVGQSTFSDVSMHDTEDEVDEDLDNEDDPYLRAIAQAARAATQSAEDGQDGEADDIARSRKSRPRRRGLNTKHAALFDAIMSPVKRYDLHRKQFSEFVPSSVRLSLPVPKVVSKSFLKQRAAKFVELYELYLKLTRLPKYVHLLHAFELFLEDLMNCFDHPNEVIGWNPFAAFANFVEAGAVVRTPSVVESCSRLTLGADWGLVSAEDQKKIGPDLHSSLLQLHLFRMAEIDELLCRWSDKFRRDSTCKTCNTDPWELFLLTTLVSLKKQGTRYIDVETASDTSSESGTDEEDDSFDKDDERDDHEGRDSSDSCDGSSDDDDDVIDPRIMAQMPLDDTQEPARAPSQGLVPRQHHLRNYGPNAYILRIVSLDEFGCGSFEKSTMRACPRCGYRFDGKDPDPNSLYAKDIKRAVSVARENITALKETINLPYRHERAAYDSE